MVDWHDPALVVQDYCALPITLAKYHTDNHLLADLSKLFHALAALYMCAPSYNTDRPVLTLVYTLVGRRFLRLASSWTCCEVKYPTDGQYG